MRNLNLEYFNVQLLGLTGRPHAAPMYISNTRDSYKLRAHLKFLTGDMLSFDKISRERGGDPRCRLCQAVREHTQHILTECRSTSDIRERLYPELVKLVADIQPSSGLLDKQQTPNRLLMQFILDPASMNLPNSHRISFQHPRLLDLYRLSRDWCYAIDSCRSKLLKAQNFV